jgi:hypothetical protein
VTLTDRLGGEEETTLTVKASKSRVSIFRPCRRYWVDGSPETPNWRGIVLTGQRAGQCRSEPL